MCGGVLGTSVVSTLIRVNTGYLVCTVVGLAVGEKM